LQLALKVPHSRYVVIGTGHELVSLITPLDRRDVVVFIRPRNLNFFVTHLADVPQLLDGLEIAVAWLSEIPEVDPAITISTCGQNSFIWVPF
jgi:hypothetical protein